MGASTLGLAGFGASALGSAVNTYSSAKSAKENANLARAQAQYMEQATAQNMDLLRQKNAMEMEALKAAQEQEMAMNEVIAVSRGNRGASAQAFFGGSVEGYLKQQNQLALSGNTEMFNLATGGSFQAQALRAQAKMYDRQSTSAIIAGAIGGVTGAINSYALASQMQPQGGSGLDTGSTSDIQMGGYGSLEDTFYQSSSSRYSNFSNTYNLPPLVGG